MSSERDTTPTRTERDDAETARRDYTQLLGTVVVLVGLALVVAQAIGLSVVLRDTTLRILLVFGVLLIAGRETIRAFLGGP